MVLMLAASGCEDPADSMPPSELIPARLGPGGDTLIPLQDGDDVDLVRPIQGGHVLFIGALFRNGTRTGGSVRGELRRSVSPQGMPLAQPGAILVYDERSATAESLPSSVSPPTADPGWRWLQPDPGNVSNIPSCPNVLEVDMVDSQLWLQVTYQDAKGRTTTAARKVSSRCRQADPSEQRQCRCECLARYTTERCLNPDGGT